MRIQAAIARANEPFEIAVCELAQPGAREVRVAVEACGICRTDLSAKDHGYGTPLPAVLGHEGVGRIESIGPDVHDFAVGQRVLMSFGACGQCRSCQEQLPGYCDHAIGFNVLGRRLSGESPIRCGGQPITGHFFGQSAFATYAIASTTNLVPLADDLQPAQMCPLACGVLTGAGALVNVLQATTDDSVGIFGCGTVGLAAVMAAKVVDAKKIVAVDVQPRRLALAAELGATHTLDPRGLDGRALAKSLRAFGLTRVLDSTGNRGVIEAAFASLRRRGQLVLAGLSPAGTRVTFDANRLMASGCTVRGTIEGDASPRRFIPQLIDWYRAGQFPLERLVTTYPFEQINQAVADMRDGAVIKPVLTMDGGR